MTLDREDVVAIAKQVVIELQGLQLALPAASVAVADKSLEKSFTARQAQCFAELRQKTQNKIEGGW